jgi:hypothetical protein
MLNKSTKGNKMEKQAIRKKTYRQSIAKDLIHQSYRNFRDDGRYVLFQGLLNLLNDEQMEVALDIRDKIREITKS